MNQRIDALLTANQRSPRTGPWSPRWRRIPWLVALAAACLTLHAIGGAPPNKGLFRPTVFATGRTTVRLTPGGVGPSPVPPKYHQAP